MFYISLEDAAKFWDYLEFKLNEWEADTKLAEELAERRTKGRLALDSFSLEWQAQLDAKAIAIQDLRWDIETARKEYEAHGEPLIIAAIDSVLRGALGDNGHGTSFEAARLVQGMARAHKRELLGEVFRFTIKEAKA